MSISASLELESPSKKERKINIFNELWTICVGNYLLVIYRIAFRLTFWRCGRCAYAPVPRYRCRRSLLMVWVGYGTTRTDCGWRRDMVYIWYLISVMSTSHINVYIHIYTITKGRCYHSLLLVCCWRTGDSLSEHKSFVATAASHLDTQHHSAARRRGEAIRSNFPMKNYKYKHFVYREDPHHRWLQVHIRYLLDDKVNSFIRNRYNLNASSRSSLPRKVRVCDNSFHFGEYAPFSYLYPFHLSSLWNIC